MTHYDIMDMAHQLRTARKNQGLSQRELSKLTGVPQAQISRIEAGSVDLRLSSLRALTRALGLELAFIPRKAVPAMRSLSGNILKPSHPDFIAARKEMRRIDTIMRSIQREMPNLDGFLLLQKTIFQLQKIRESLLDPDMLKKLRRALKEIPHQTDGKTRDETLDESLALANMIYAKAIQAPPPDKEHSPPPPAYSLDDETDDD